MTYRNVFTSAVPRIERLVDFGFESADDSGMTGKKIYACEKPLSAEGFYVRLTLDTKARSFEAQVFDGATGERYALFDLPSSHGAFVGGLRREVRGIVDDFCRICCDTSSLYDDYVDFLRERFGVEPDYPWAGKNPSSETDGKNRAGGDYSDASVFRRPNGKWFALLMNITYKNLGAGDDLGRLWVANLKADPDLIPSLIDRRSVFPAYHMNKKHWITVALTAATDFERLKALTERSCELVD